MAKFLFVLGTDRGVVGLIAAGEVLRHAEIPHSRRALSMQLDHHLKRMQRRIPHARL
jgi:hypothetical protein